MTANVAQLFFDVAHRQADRLAFVSGGPSGRRITFGELRRSVERFAGGLASQGFREGDRALFLLPMSPELYVAVLGALTAGGVAVFVDPWVPLRQIARLAADARPAAVIGTPRAHLLRLLAPELRRVRISVTTGGLGSSIAARLRFDDLTGTAAVVRVPPDAPALITYTTGSSGAPKAVNRTHAILAAQHHVIREEFPTEATDVDLTTFPVFALSNLASGVTTVIPRVDLRRVSGADPAVVLGDIQEFGVATAAASPPLFDLLAERLRATGASPPALRRIVTGGAPVRDDQLRRWRDAFPAAQIVVAFGSSEAEPVASISADDRLAIESPGLAGYCAGTPVQAVRTRIARITHGPMERVADAQSGTVGELLVAGPHVCREYVDDPGGRAFADNKVREPDGLVWHRMGDTGYFDAQGRFWLVGRVHSTIRRAGVDVHAQLVEQAARGSDVRVRRVAALGIPDQALGQRLVVVIESDDPGVVAAVRDRLAANGGVPADELIVTRKPLPVDPRHNSKIDYQRLRVILQAGSLE
ncbi:MAG TPA: AMP-binding protein [Gemmatimonadaceae bacterium]|nr:AMP-binding protein [Gemmatimonadaceae bacterium]